MLHWLNRRRNTAAPMGAKPEALIYDIGVGAPCEALRKEHEAKSWLEVRTWIRVALTAAQKAHKRLGLGLAAAIQRATEADFATIPERAPSPQRD
jgi:hypothetical protein